MLKHLCCDTPTRRARIAWVSFMPGGHISVGLNDKTYVAPRFKGQIFLWNAYNRVRTSYEVPSDPTGCDHVKNPHFTYHPDVWFHLKPSRKKHGGTLFEAIADVPIMLHQDSWVPWILAVSSPIQKLPSGGKRPGRIVTDELVIQSSTENVSIRIEVDFVKPEHCDVREARGWEWAYAWGKVGLRVRMFLTNPQIATLGWVHFH
jgi:hypothetical protein